MLVLGGGGYKIKNVARLWTYETGVLLGALTSVVWLSEHFHFPVLIPLIFGRYLHALLELCPLTTACE